MLLRHSGQGVGGEYRGHEERGRDGKREAPHRRSS
jgi:hypothetical protein